MGEIELSDAQREKLVLQAARGMMQAGKKPTVRGVCDWLKGRVGWNRVVTILGSLRERGMLLTKESHKKADPKVEETGRKKTSVTMPSRGATQDPKGLPDPWGLIALLLAGLIGHVDVRAVRGQTETPTLVPDSRQ